MKEKIYATLDEAVADIPDGERGWTAEEVQALTGAQLIARQQIPEMSFA